jgi:hypothetical protein
MLVFLVPPMLLPLEQRTDTASLVLFTTTHDELEEEEAADDDDGSGEVECAARPM